jgi:hypothetical protein
MQEFLIKWLPIIMYFVVILIGVSLPVFAVLVYKKFHGSAKYSQACKLAEAAIQFIVGYFKAHPEAAKDAEIIYNMFKARIIAVLPLTDAEIDYLFAQLEIALADLIGVDPSIFNTLSKATLIKKKAPKLFRRHKRLFS